MATAEQMRHLHPDPPTCHIDYQRAVRDALTWLIDADGWRVPDPTDQDDPTDADIMIDRAAAVVRALLRYGTPGDPS